MQWLTFVFIFPLTFASNAFVPTQGMNAFLKAFVENQPISQIVETVRALMLGLPVGNRRLLAVLWSLGILAVAMPFAAYLFKKKSL